MTDHKMYDFVAGDIVRYREKTYQVHENLGMSGLVAEYPSPEVMLVVVTWDDDYVKTGNEPLADTSSCGSCTSTDCSSSPLAPPKANPQEPVPLRFLDSNPPAKK
ncbi:MAG: hypothetical protein K9K86_01325 [Pseudomonadales bacterium]|nr:hypothetical protein [Pseudomonadales bacterium]